MPFRVRRTITEPDGTTDVKNVGNHPTSQAAWTDANDQCDTAEDTLLLSSSFAERLISKEPGLMWLIELDAGPDVNRYLWEVFEV